MFAPEGDRITRPVQVQCPPPAYAREDNFCFDLSSILKPSEETRMHLSLSELRDSKSLELLQARSTLDHGQIAAFRHSLLHEFALTQGPPGTGKTFLGVQLTRVLLASRQSRKPILVVCLTNHALDSFLEDLKDAGVNSLIRIGAGSKEDWTDAINIRDRRRKHRFSPLEMQTMGAFRTDGKDAFSDLELRCQSLSVQNMTGQISWNSIEDVLRTNHAKIHQQFAVGATSPYARAFAFDYWASGGDLHNIKNSQSELTARLAEITSRYECEPFCHVDDLTSQMSRFTEYSEHQAGSTSIWNKPLMERRSLVARWESEVNVEDRITKLVSLYSQHRNSENLLQPIRVGRDVRVLEDHDVIGMTTTACAAQWDLLKEVELETVICEEAGEVLEPHALCALLPTVQHAIFIGDPLQLRPDVTTQALSLEKNMNYRLDESLFERMMLPKDPASLVLPRTQLTIQRRMHPDIADIARLTYPFLLDHELTQILPPTMGVEQRMCWWDHRVPEVGDTGITKSHVNQYEVEMVIGLVTHLLNGSAYSHGDIAILTPYSGQLARLRESLKSTCKIWLGEKDRETLLDEGLLEDSENKPAAKDEVRVAEMLRIATVDSFQGQEAKVVILTTVRSGGRPGFLQNVNRINVACSRAQHGLYIIGNSQTLRQVPMWRAVLDVFGQRRGYDLVVSCSNHRQHRQPIKTPNDFKYVTACSEPCTHVFECGHRCAEMCHAAELHDRNLIHCQTRCEKVFANCGHRCNKSCSMPCGRCNLSVGEKVLECGHLGNSLCSGKFTECMRIVGQQTLSCGHFVDIHCGDEKKMLLCHQPCFALLSCGHKCTGNCGSCQRSGHNDCASEHNRLLPCGHVCKSICHPGNCPPCSEPVEAQCDHGTRTRPCHDPPEPCLKARVSGCQHESCVQTPCCLPSTEFPCSALCTTVLACGHICPSLDSESCIPARLCPQCVVGESSKTIIYVPECGEVVDVESLDSKNLRQVCEIDKVGNISHFKYRMGNNLEPASCVCGTPCPSVRRYRVVGQLIQFRSVLDQVLVKMHRGISKSSSQVSYLERELDSTLDTFKRGLRPNPLAANSNAKLIMQRDREILDLRRQIMLFKDQVVYPFEKGLDAIHKRFPGMAEIKFLSHLHFTCLEYRATAIHLLDNLKLAAVLLSLDDPSDETHRLGKELLQYAMKEASTYVDITARAVPHAETLMSPSLVAEIRLHQAQFWSIARQAQFKLLKYALPVDVGIASEHETGLALLDSLDTVIKVPHQQGRADGGLVESALQYKQMLANIKKIDATFRVLKINNSGMRHMEKLFASYNTEGLGTCEAMHRYSQQLFPAGCPNCGKIVESTDEVFREKSKNLFENDFLAAMRRGLSTSKSPAESECEVQMSACAGSLTPQSECEEGIIDARCSTTDPTVQVGGEESIKTDYHYHGGATPVLEKGVSEHESAESEISAPDTRVKSNAEKFLEAMHQSSAESSTREEETDETSAREGNNTPGVVPVASPSSRSGPGLNVSQHLFFEEQFLIAMKKKLAIEEK